MNLSQSEQSENSNASGIELINTSNPNNKSELRLGWDMNLPSGFCTSKRLKS